MRRFHFVLLGLALLIAQPILAKTYYVGNCKTGAYSTISAAVASVPAGSIIDVCPGTYAEQVVISQPLTLQAYASGGSDQAMITLPSAAPTTTSSIVFGTVAAQVEVTAGPVNITGITVDGGISSGCPDAEVVGIFYSSSSSGTLNTVQTQFQGCNTVGVGILAENGSETPASVTIENSNTNLSGSDGIYVCGSALSAAVKNNYLVENNGNGIVTDCNATAAISGNVVNAAYANRAILLMSSSSTVTGNTVTGAPIVPAATGVVVSGNTVTASGAGIWIDGAAKVTSNHISDGTFGIVIAVPGSTVQSNFISQEQIGIEFQCVTAIVSGNTIAGPGESGPGTGFDKFPGTSTGTNKFYNVGTLTTGCSGT